MRFGTRARWNSARPTTALLTILLLVAVSGCGARKTDQSRAASESQGQSQGQTAANETMVANVLPSLTQGSGAARPVRVHRITLTNRRCIRFEPQWTSVHVGEAVVWRSELKTPMRIYVSPGVFDRVSFLVRPGATVNTGPARSVGRFSFSTEPCACREAPRGVLLAGPGVNVRETFYASAPGVH